MMALNFHESDECRMTIDPSGSPWKFDRTGTGEDELVTIRSHDGTYLGSFTGPHAGDNATHLCSMLRVCDGVSPEQLSRMRVTLRDLMCEAGFPPPETTTSGAPSTEKLA